MYNIINIYNGVFYNKNFTGILTLPDSLTSIEDNAFLGN